MKDKRMDKIAQHYDIFIDGKKFKVLSCTVHEDGHSVSIKTKVRGQAFPRSGLLVIGTPAENAHEEISVRYKTMCSSPAIEHWEYTVAAK
ncbi:MAG: hypothetical protein E7559_08080 [Ruminococcaceae bacterium]|nr:hypothetical protein [Oscillospiraceae bacterium]